MGLWQKAMIGLARKSALERFMQGSPFCSELADQFVGGPNAETGAARAQQLARQGFRASLFYLGEYVGDPDLVAENVAQKIRIAERLAQAGLDVHISVDPAQIGYAQSDAAGQANALRIARAIVDLPAPGRTGGPVRLAGGPVRRTLMLDMEDFSIVQRTIDLHGHLRDAGLPAAITIQAYLHRGEEDIERLVEQGATVRLVKGAFAESAERAFTRRRDIDAAYLRLATRLLSPQAKERGVYPAFGTHDERLIAAIRSQAQQQGWPNDRYEFELLYGVRRPLQARIVQDHSRLRLYLPFGQAWWPYTVRRIGENPANLWFVLRALTGRNR
jgi:proline dehydrogenase